MQELLPGDPRAVGPYRIAARLGAGGMGVVFLGRDAEGRDAAVKVARAELAEDGDFRRRLADEVAALRRVDGAHTARVLDADPAAEPPWLACEYVPGPTLVEVLDRTGTLDAQAWDALARGLGRALVAVHAAGVVHRDLKPGNVLLSPAGPRVLDFGIARLLDGTGGTATGHLVGSVGWLSPEQLRGEPLTPAVDLFAAGLLLALAGTGRPAFGAGAFESVSLRTLAGEPDLEGLSVGQRRIVAALLQPAAADRPSAAGLVALTGGPASPTAGLDRTPGPVATPTAVLAPTPTARLGPLAGGGAGPTWGTTAGRRHGRRTAVGVVVVVLGLLAAVLAVLLVTRGSGPTTTHPPAATPSASVATPTPPTSGGGPASGDLGHALDQLRSSGSALSGVLSTLSADRAAVAPALQQVRGAVTAVTAAAGRTPRDCRTLQTLGDTAMNAQVSLASNTGAALDNGAGAVEQAATSLSAAADTAQADGAPGSTTDPARSQAAAARSAAQDARGELAQAKSTAAGLLAQAQQAVLPCG